jgi:serine/threonine protein kinase
MATPTPGSVFGQYRIIDSLGRGGMASVFRAHEAALDRFVALKVLPAEFLHEESFAARFEREAKVVAKLEHPNIIPIFAFGIEQGIPWMSMRLISGGSLSGPLKAGQITRERAVQIIRAVADGLTYAHAHGVVHRDIKPQNILVDEHGGVYLADFGIARMVEGGASITRTGLVSGTPQYMAPEQATGQPVDHRVDIYALGIVAYELFTGAAPFTADTPVAVLLKQVSAPIPIPSSEHVPEALLGPLMKCLAKVPGDRWQTAAEFAQAIERGMALVTTTVGSVPPSLPTTVGGMAPTAPSPIRRPPPLPAGAKSSGQGLLIALVVFGLLLLVGGVAIGGYLILRPAGQSEDRASPVPALSPIPSTDQTPVTWPTPGTVTATDGGALPAPSPTASVAPLPSPSKTASAHITSPSPLVPETSVSTAPATPTPGAATPSATTLPKGAHTFRLNEKTVMGLSDGPVSLLTAQFKSGKLDEVETLLEFQCAKGHDQSVTYSVALLDASGASLATLKGKKTIEEKDKATFKHKQPLPPGTLDNIRAFTVTFTSASD